MSPVGFYFNKDSKLLLGMEFAKIVWSSGESRVWSSTLCCSTKDGKEQLAGGGAR